MRIASFAGILLFVALVPAVAARADDDAPANKPAADEGGPKLGEASVEKWKIGVVVSVSGGPAVHLTATNTIPMDWPEQSVKIVDQDLSPGVTVKYKSYGTAKQMLANIPRVSEGKDVHAFLIVEVTRHTLLPPDDTEGLVAAEVRSLPAEFKAYLGNSELIETTDPRIKKIAKELAQGQTKAWPHVRAIYDWVRKTIKYKEMEHKPGEVLDTCVEAIDKGTGDCNQLTSAFIAICRASGIPARTVRIPSHCYPEFYLKDAQGRGHWYPAEASGGDDFGGIRTSKPILQKGDAIRMPVSRIVHGRLLTTVEPVRFLSGDLKSMNTRGGGKPALKLVCEPVE